MTDKLIAGIDFSGAKQVPNDTYIAIGRLGSTGLEITDIRKIGSHMAAKELQAVHFTAVGVDVPFSLPAEFLAFMAKNLGKKGYNSWQEVAEDMIFMSFETFLAFVVDFKREPKRAADKATSRAAQSPLHRGNPSMVQMTYQGIRLLASLDPDKFRVLPFQDAAAGACSIMEVYPREALYALGLPDTGYKSKDKNDKDAVTAVRKSIVENLVDIREQKGISHKGCPRLRLSPAMKAIALDTDHALDALIACYNTALWLTTPEYFVDPLELDDINILLEGWIYSPKQLSL